MCNEVDFIGWHDDTAQVRVDGYCVCVTTHHWHFIDVNEKHSEKHAETTRKRTFACVGDVLVEENHCDCDVSDVIT